jgi:hypothetical protein
MTHSLPNDLLAIGDALHAGARHDLARGRTRRRRATVALLVCAFAVSASIGGAAAAGVSPIELFTFTTVDGVPVDPGDVTMVESELVRVEADGTRVTRTTNLETGEVTIERFKPLDPGDGAVIEGFFEPAGATP